MKRFLITMLLAIMMGTGAYAQKTYVLLAGISKYDNPLCPDLEMTAKNIKQIKKIIDKQKNTTNAIITGKFVNKENFNTKLEAIVKLAQPNDKICIFYAGHGAPGELVFYQGLSYKYTDLMKVLSQAKTKNIFCFIEACYSGSIRQLMKDASKNEVNPVFIVSSREDETSGALRFTENGFFSLALTKALRGKADANNDKKLTVQEIYKYVYNDVIDHDPDGTQHPQLIGPSSLYDTVITEW